MSADLRCGFAKIDITPPVGVELCGFGPYLRRRSNRVRDPLWARGFAVSGGGGSAVVVSCDLGGTARRIVLRARELFAAATGLPGETLMVLSTHTHSGPTSIDLFGWGEPDAPWLELLPGRIARAATQAWAAREPASLAHGEAPCEGIGQNREYDRDALPIAEVLAPGWRPLKPELTDTVVRALVATATDGRLLGVVSHFGCHPVVCCQETFAIHGDYCGVADSLLEAEHPGAVAMFVQGAQGDVNSSVVHKPEAESLAALDVLARRYADCVGDAMRRARPIAVDAVVGASRGERFARKPWTLARIERDIAAKQALIDAAADTSDWRVRLEVVYLRALTRIAENLRRGDEPSPPIELHGVRLGPVAILASPFETFQAIKNDVVAGAAAPHTWVASFANDSVGYATDRVAAARGGYAEDQVPLMYGFMPYASAHDDLVAGLLRLDADLAARSAPASQAAR
ncbi:MAG TPA: neutral/alkaline non-lysosomal ceramidase N-terminal domain-containing protein [Planctomycetota bacterium]|nr:neutral/alkaline non-lysosomal ceramidase N-terminal domain-containing protein [Planctomycetota bacterium]